MTHARSGGIYIAAQRHSWSNWVDLLIGDGRRDPMEPGGMRRYAKQLVFEQVEEGELCQPTMTISPAAAQGLMDELWHCGLRPSEGSGSAGSLAATQRHLEDMRTLVFGSRGSPK